MKMHAREMRAEARLESAGPLVRVESCAGCGGINESRLLAHRQNRGQVLMNPQAKLRNKNVDARRHQEKKR